MRQAGSLKTSVNTDILSLLVEFGICKIFHVFFFVLFNAYHSVAN